MDLMTMTEEMMMPIQPHRLVVQRILTGQVTSLRVVVSQVIMLPFREVPTVLPIISQATTISRMVL